MRNAMLVLLGIAVGCAGAAVGVGTLTVGDAAAGDDASATCGCEAEVTALQAQLAELQQQAAALDAKMKDRAAQLDAAAEAAGEALAKVTMDGESACTFARWDEKTGQIIEGGECLCTATVNDVCLAYVRHGVATDYSPEGWKIREAHYDHGEYAGGLFTAWQSPTCKQLETMYGPDGKSEGLSRRWTMAEDGTCALTACRCDLHGEKVWDTDPGSGGTIADCDTKPCP